LKKLHFWMVRTQPTTSRLVRDRQAAKRCDDREHVHVHDGEDVRGDVREIAL
jgi:hypothetical protein